MPTESLLIESMEIHCSSNDLTRKVTNSADPYGVVLERTSEELRKIMKGQQPEVAIQKMFESGLLTKLLNLPEELHDLTMDQQNIYHKLNIINHTLEVIKHTNNLAMKYDIDDDMRMMMNLSALWHDIGKLDPRTHRIKPSGDRGYTGATDAEGNLLPGALEHSQVSKDLWDQFADSLKLSNEERETVGNLVAEHMTPHAHVEGRRGTSDKTLRRFKRKNPNWLIQYILGLADAMSKSTDPEEGVSLEYEKNMERLQNLQMMQGNFPGVQDLLGGQEIMAIIPELPPKPPPHMEKGFIEMVKEDIRNEQDANPNLTIEQARDLVIQNKLRYIQLYTS